MKSKSRVRRPADMPVDYPWGWNDWSSMSTAGRRQAIVTWNEIKELALSRVLPKETLKEHFLIEDAGERAKMLKALRSTKQSFLRKGWIPSWSFRVQCSGQLHTISMDNRGRLHFHNHDIADIKKTPESGEKVMGKLGMRYGCQKFYRAWQRSFGQYWWSDWSSEDCWMPRHACRAVADVRDRNGGRRPKALSMKGGALSLIGLCSLKEAHRRVMSKIVRRIIAKSPKTEIRQMDNGTQKAFPIADPKIVSFRREGYYRSSAVGVDLANKDHPPRVISLLTNRRYAEVHIRVRLPMDWKRKVYDKGKSVLGGNFVLDVLEPKGKTGVGPGSVVLVAVGTPKGTKLFQHYRAEIGPGGRTLNLLDPVKEEKTWVPKENDDAEPAGAASTP